MENYTYMSSCAIIVQENVAIYTALAIFCRQRTQIDGYKNS